MGLSQHSEKNEINVLLVDDRPDGLLALEAVLGRSRYRLFTASSGREALSQVFDREFAVIILDVQMPGMDGFDTAKVIRQREISRSTPILFVTAINKDLDHVRKGYGLGAVDYLFKPFDPLVLQSKVAVFADLYEKNLELMRQTERVQQSEERKRLILETANDIIATCDVNRVITSLNPAFEQVLGLPTRAWIGQPIENLVPVDDRDLFARDFLGADPTQDAGLQERSFVCADGNHVVLEYSVRPIVENTVPTGSLIVARDISERKRAEKERRKRYELERSNQELEQFAYVCSHDLQEPLRMIGSFTQLLERKLNGKLDPQAGEYLKYIVEGSKRMSELIRDILEFAQFGTEHSLEEISLSDSVEQAKTMLRETLHDTRAEILASPLPRVMGVSSELTRLFQNLIGNAVKFRGDRTPKIDIRASNDGTSWFFQVKDNGIGFDQQFAEQIFQIFKRLHGKEEYSGTGMGLAICKKIVERHGGKIWAESKLGEGTSFYFTLPMLDGDTVTRPMSPHAGAQASAVS
jgi:PAS domain S-box-containing protein